MTSSAPLSIVLVTTQPWPTLRAGLARLRAQAAASNAELIVVDGTRTSTGLPTSERAGIQWHARPGASVFTLRAAGLEAAHGDIVAFTEDHCLPREDWCERLRALHAAHPEADAIGGAVLNGSTTRLIDCANFGLTFAPFVPPLGVGLADRAPAIANVSYKRRVLPAAPPPPGWLEVTLNERLLTGGRIAFDDHLVVEHAQSHGFLGTFAAHFHNGRSTTGLVASALDGPTRRRRLRRSVAHLPGLLRGTLATLRAKGALAGRQRACIPLLAALVACHGVGEVIGLAAGPGSSPSRLR